MPRSLTGDLARLLTFGLAGLTVLTAYAALRIEQEGARDERDQPVDAIVVLGAAQYEGRPSAVFRARLDHAVELFRARVAPYLVVTGGPAEGETLSEAEVARRYARDQGVPDAAILSEETGGDTLASLRNVAALLSERGVSRALFVSDRTHMLRVLVIARDLGITGFGSPTPLSPADREADARARAVARELAALAGYLLLKV